MIYRKIILIAFLAAGVGASFASLNHSRNNQWIGKSDVSVQTTEISKEMAQKVIANYLEIKDALVQTNGKTASAAARQLVSLLSASKDELAVKILFDAQHIADTTDPEHQRAHFSTLSDNVYTMVKTTGANESSLYRQYCPMARDNTGAYWISSEKEVNNPYFGDKMLRCGSVKEVLE